MSLVVCPSLQWGGGRASGSGQAKRAGGRANRSVQMSGRQGHVIHRTFDGTGGMESLGDSGNLACRVAAATACRGRLCHDIRVRINPNPTQ